MHVTLSTHDKVADNQLPVQQANDLEGYKDVFVFRNTSNKLTFAQVMDTPSPSSGTFAFATENRFGDILSCDEAKMWCANRCSVLYLRKIRLSEGFQCSNRRIEDWHCFGKIGLTVVRNRLIERSQSSSSITQSADTSTLRVPNHDDIDTVTVAIRLAKTTSGATLRHDHVAKMKRVDLLGERTCFRSPRGSVMPACTIKIAVDELPFHLGIRCTNTEPTECL